MAENPTIKAAIARAERLSQAMRVIVGVTDAAPGDNFADVEGLVPPNAVRIFWDKWPPAEMHEEESFSATIKRSGLRYMKEDYEPGFKAIDTGLHVIADINENGKLKLGREEVDRHLAGMFKAISDLYLQIIDDAGRHTEEGPGGANGKAGHAQGNGKADAQKIEFDHRVNRRKDVLQILVAQLGASIREIKEAVRAEYTGVAPDQSSLRL